MLPACGVAGARLIEGALQGDQASSVRPMARSAWPRRARTSTRPRSPSPVGSGRAARSSRAAAGAPRSTRRAASVSSRGPRGRRRALGAPAQGPALPCPGRQPAPARPPAGRATPPSPRPDRSRGRAPRGGTTRGARAPGPGAVPGEALRGQLPGQRPAVGRGAGTSRAPPGRPRPRTERPLLAGDAHEPEQGALPPARAAGPPRRGSARSRKTVLGLQRARRGPARRRARTQSGLELRRAAGPSGPVPAERQLARAPSARSDELRAARGGSCPTRRCSTSGAPRSGRGAPRSARRGRGPPRVVPLRAARAGGPRAPPSS